jgi:hypothetical protein
VRRNVSIPLVIGKNENDVGMFPSQSRRLEGKAGREKKDEMENKFHRGRMIVRADTAIVNKGYSNFLEKL